MFQKQMIKLGLHRCFTNWAYARNFTNKLSSLKDSRNFTNKLKIIQLIV